MAERHSHIIPDVDGGAASTSILSKEVKKSGLEKNNIHHTI